MSKHKTPRPSFKARMTQRGRDTAHLGRTLWHEPRSFPAELLVLFKRSVRTLWNARGGGLYATGFVLAFIALEIQTLIDEVMGASGVGAFVSEQLMEFLLRFTFDSLGNTIQAFLWPLLLIDRYEGWGIVALAILYAVFPRFIKPALTRWLFDDGESSPETR